MVERLQVWLAVAGVGTGCEVFLNSRRDKLVRDGTCRPSHSRAAPRGIAKEFKW